MRTSCSMKGQRTRKKRGCERERDRGRERASETERQGERARERDRETDRDREKARAHVCIEHTNKEMCRESRRQHQVDRRLLLDVVVRERAAVLELPAGKDQPLLVRGDGLLILDLVLDVLDRVRGLDVQSDGLARKRFDKYLQGRARRREGLSGVDNRQPSGSGQASFSRSHDYVRAIVVRHKRLSGRYLRMRCLSVFCASLRVFVCAVLRDRTSL